MTRLLRAIGITFLLLTTAAFSVAVSAGPDSEIRDIRGPVHPSGFPPFAVSMAILLLAAGVAVSSTVAVRRRRMPEPESASVPCHDELLLLRDAYLKGDLTDQQLFDRLSSLLRSIFPAANHYSLTSTELFTAVKGDLPEELFDCAEKLFELCDRVRFGGYPLGRNAVVSTLDDALTVVRQLPERGR